MSLFLENRKFSTREVVQEGVIRCAEDFSKLVAGFSHPKLINGRFLFISGSSTEVFPQDWDVEYEYTLSVHERGGALVQRLPNFKVKYFSGAVFQYSREEMRAALTAFLDKHLS